MAAAAAAAADGMALPTVFEQAAAGVAVGVAGSGGSQQLCIVRDLDAARMGGCDEQTRLTLQVRPGPGTSPTVSEYLVLEYLVWSYGCGGRSTWSSVVQAWGLLNFFTQGNT